MSKKIKKFKLSTICDFNNYDSIVFKPTSCDQKLLEDPDGDLVLLEDYKKLEQKYEECIWQYDRLVERVLDIVEDFEAIMDNVGSYPHKYKEE